MSGTPPPEIQLDAHHARELLRQQFPNLASLPLTPLGSGWDNFMFRVGSQHVLRLPRRALAAPLIRHEQRWLPQIQSLVPLKIPAPTHLGIPALGYPWHWSVSPWIEGDTADLHRPDASQGVVLAGFLKALHVAAPADAPRNEYRGVPLLQRLAHFEACVQRVRPRSDALEARHFALWQRALAAPLDVPETWIHGDLHPRNVLVEAGHLSGVIDWGDVARGDRATDLAAIWMLLPDLESRRAAMAELEGVSLPTWDRARGWAVLFAAILLNAGLHDDARMALIAQRTLHSLIEGPGNRCA